VNSTKFINLAAWVFRIYSFHVFNVCQPLRRFPVSNLNTALLYSTDEVCIAVYFFFGYGGNHIVRMVRKKLEKYSLVCFTYYLWTLDLHTNSHKLAEARMPHNASEGPWDIFRFTDGYKDWDYIVIIALCSLLDRLQLLYWLDVVPYDSYQEKKEELQVFTARSAFTVTWH
jgi:hypothetical protein